MTPETNMGSGITLHETKTGSTLRDVVLQMLVDGLDEREIAQQLEKSIFTIKRIVLGIVLKADPNRTRPIKDIKDNLIPAVIDGVEDGSLSVENLAKKPRRDLSAQEALILALTVGRIDSWTIMRKLKIVPLQFDLFRDNICSKLGVSNFLGAVALGTAANMQVQGSKEGQQHV
ncbi:hypothetical protein A2W45_03835 [Candidatus Curtissbacteria bacterium RIFCSPHIGHO2_12_41_11]|uniref:Uncharacterized protein n=3 Tax=Candidatus Curtissiibacteriota TaxID=1752717 RepID=A0A1F5HQA8_9BACT|nr:MAG: hypothetical protein A2W45_03835 [Candidatus Curtissbacteria bacterium RIFCSPHIGHO2_12_41_11]OGE06263.1 MAG: hypothetical protein A2W70_00295 [Candidatus Curtissbacteria bacterium RIFCSPLOWO2_02_41_11]